MFRGQERQISALSSAGNGLEAELPILCLLARLHRHKLDGSLGGDQMNTILPTTLVGSYPQPDWLIDRGKLGKYVPRVRAQELWRVGEEWLDQAQNDATLLAIRDQETAGIDILTDGEMRRESYSNRFATALEGVDIENRGTR